MVLVEVCPLLLRVFGGTAPYASGSGILPYVLVWFARASSFPEYPKFRRSLNSIPPRPSDVSHRVMGLFILLLRPASIGQPLVRMLRINFLTARSSRHLAFERPPMGLPWLSQWLPGTPCVINYSVRGGWHTSGPALRSRACRRLPGRVGAVPEFASVLHVAS